MLLSLAASVPHRCECHRLLRLGRPGLGLVNACCWCLGWREVP